MMLSFRKGSEGERTAVIFGPNGRVDGEGYAVELKLNGNVNVNKRRQSPSRVENTPCLVPCLSLASALTVRFIIHNYRIVN